MRLSSPFTGPQRPAADDSEDFRVETIRGTDLTAEHVDAWRRIIAANISLDSPFYSPTFVQAVADVGCDVQVAVLRSNGRIRGFLPCQFATPWHRRFGIAERAGGELSDYFGLIGEPDIRILPPDLLRLCNLSALAFTHLDETQVCYGLTGTNPEPGLKIRLSEGSAAYWAALAQSDKRLISDTERRTRKLVQTYGPLRFELDAANTHDELNRLIAVKRAQYSRTNAHDALSDDQATDLLALLAARKDPQCRGQLSVLFAGDTWIASHFGLRNHHLLHYWFPVYHPDLKAYSPGRLLLKAIIDAADGAGIDMIDRGSGDQPAKREFAHASHQ
ncbi:MAG: GNAT family N-acetyltransferase, partial [Rhodospirillaceae bacterium]